MTGDVSQSLADLRAGQREHGRRIDGIERRQETVMALPVELKALSKRMDERFEEFSDRIDDRLERMEAMINAIQKQMDDSRRQSEERGRYYSDHRINEEQLERTRRRDVFYFIAGIITLLLGIASLLINAIQRVH